MLETIREFGLEQLASLGELDVARQEHASLFLNFAETADQTLRGPHQGAALARLEAEHDNLRAALAWSLSVPDRADETLRLAGILHWFWYLRGYFSEGRQWLEEALAEPAAAAGTLAHARALAGAGVLAFFQGDFPAAREMLGASIAIGRERNDPATVAYALQALVAGDLPHADHETLRQQCAENVALYRQVGDRWGLALALRNLGLVTLVTRKFEQAAAPFAESLALSREVGDAWLLARVLHYAGELARFRGDDEGARALYGESLALYDDLDFHAPAALVRHNLGYVAQHQGNPRLGLSYFAVALARQVKHEDRLNIGHCLAGVAGMVAELGRPAPAARLFGAAAALLTAMGASFWPVDKVDFDRNLNETRALLGEEAFAAAFAAGGAMPLAQAIADAFAVKDEIDAAARADDAPSADATPAAAAAFGLTSRELEILQLLTRRATDREIADQLSISPRTVMHHVSSILTKLGVANRRAAAAVAARHGIG